MRRAPMAEDPSESASVAKTHVENPTIKTVCP